MDKYSGGQRFGFSAGYDISHALALEMSIDHPMRRFSTTGHNEIRDTIDDTELTGEAANVFEVTPAIRCQTHAGKFNIYARAGIGFDLIRYGWIDSTVYDSLDHVKSRTKLQASGIKETRLAGGLWIGVSYPIFRKFRIGLCFGARRSFRYGDVAMMTSWALQYQL